MVDRFRLRTLTVRLLPLALCSVAPVACDGPPERDDIVELDDIVDDAGDVELRFNTPLTNYPTLITSMNATTYGGNNGGCWDTAPSGNVRPFQQYPCHAHENQLWLFEPVGDAFVIHSADDEDLCLDVPGFNFASGQNLQMYPCNGGINQKWKVFAHDAQSATIRPSSNAALCVDVENGIKTNQSPIQLFGCTGNANQAWKFHDWAGEDTSIDCDWSLRFGPEVVSPGQRRSFFATGQHFNTLCSENLESDSVSCPAWADWFVVDSPWGSDDFDVRCFNVQ